VLSWHSLYFGTHSTRETVLGGGGFLPTFFLALVAFAAFSAGAASANRRYRIPPGPFASPAAWECLLALFVVLVPIFARRVSIHGWKLAAILAVLAAMSGFVARMIAIRLIPRSISSISGDFGILDPATAPPSGWRRGWETWKRVAQPLGDYQAHLLLTLFYFCILAPVALCVSAAQNPLRLHARGSGWAPRTQSDSSLQDGRRQF
jgi:hypothetical protein